jgi:hypothetical protein
VLCLYSDAGTSFWAGTRVAEGRRKNFGENFEKTEGRRKNFGERPSQQITVDSRRNNTIKTKSTKHRRLA